MKVRVLHLPPNFGCVSKRSKDPGCKPGVLCHRRFESSPHPPINSGRANISSVSAKRYKDIEPHHAKQQVKQKSYPCLAGAVLAQTSARHLFQTRASAPEKALHDDRQEQVKQLNFSSLDGSSQKRPKSPWAECLPGIPKPSHRNSEKLKLLVFRISCLFRRFRQKSKSSDVRNTSKCPWPPAAWGNYQLELCPLATNYHSGDSYTQYYFKCRFVRTGTLGAIQ